MGNPHVREPQWDNSHEEQPAHRADYIEIISNSGHKYLITAGRNLTTTPAILDFLDVSPE